MSRPPKGGHRHRRRPAAPPYNGTAGLVLQLLLLIIIAAIAVRPVAALIRPMPYVRVGSTTVPQDLAAAAPTANLTWGAPMVPRRVGTPSPAGGMLAVAIGTDEADCTQKDASAANLAAQPTRGFVNFGFTAPAAGFYALGMHAYAPDSLANSFWLQWDTALSAAEFGTGKSRSIVPMPVELETGSGFNEACFHLGAGPHELRLYAREAGAAIAALAVDLVPPLALNATAGCDPYCIRAAQAQALTFELSNFCGPSGMHPDLVRVNGRRCVALTQVAQDRVRCVLPDGLLSAYDGDATTAEITVELRTAATTASPTTHTIVVSIDAVPRASAALAAWVIALIAVAVVVVVAALVGLGLRAASGGGGKSLANCPLDEAEPFAVLFVGLANEATLNDLYTEASVNEAVSAMAKLVRAAVRDAKCFEAQRVDEGTFMVVAKTPERALDCAARISATVNDVGVRDGPNRALKLCHVRAGQRTPSRNNSRASSRQGSAMIRGNTNNNSSNNSTSPTYAKSHNAKSRTNTNNNNNNNNQQSESEDGRDDAAMRTVGLKVTSGIAFGFGTIDHDAEHEVLSYRGGILAVAASVTDAGVPGQIVVTERLVDAVIEDDATVDGRFEFYLSANVGGDASSVCLSKRSGSKTNAEANTMHTFLPTTQPAAATDQLKEAIAQRQQQKSGAHEGAGGLDIGAGGGGDVTATGIMSALTRAETGVAPRRCSIAVVYVPEFADPGVADQHVAKHATTMVGIIAAAAKRNRCHVHEIVGSTIFVSANAVGGTVSNPGFRTATFARDVIDGLANSSSSAAAGITVTGADGNVGPQQQQQSGGLAIGLCGGSAPAAGFIHDANVVAGPLADHARLALAAARALELPCVLAVWGTSTHESDVDSHFVTVPVDAASSCTTRTRKRPEGGRTALLCSVEHARDTTGGEWLYSFQQASNTTTADFGDAADGTGAAGTWQAFLDGALPALPASTPPTPRMSPKPAELVASPSAAVDPATHNNTNDDTSGPALLPHQNDETIEQDGEPARPPPASPAAVAAADEDSDPLTRTNTIAATRLSRARREAGSAKEYAMLRAQELLGVFAGL